MCLLCIRRILTLINDSKYFKYYFMWKNFFLPISYENGTSINFSSSVWCHSSCIFFKKDVHSLAINWSFMQFPTHIWTLRFELTWKKNFISLLVLRNYYFMKRFYVFFMIFKQFPFTLMWRRWDFMSLPEIN